MHRPCSYQQSSSMNSARISSCIARVPNASVGWLCKRIDRANSQNPQVTAFVNDDAKSRKWQSEPPNFYSLRSLNPESILVGKQFFQKEQLPC